MKKSRMNGWEFLGAIIAFTTFNWILSTILIATGSHTGATVLSIFFTILYIYIYSERAEALGRNGLLATYISMVILAGVGIVTSFYLFLGAFAINFVLTVFMACANAKEIKINKLK